MPHASPPSSFAPSAPQGHAPPAPSAPSAPPGTRRPKRHRPSRVCPACGLDTAAVRASYRPSLGGLFADCPRCQRPVLSKPPPPTIQRWRFGRRAIHEERNALIIIILLLYFFPAVVWLIPAGYAWDGELLLLPGPRTPWEDIAIDYALRLALFTLAGLLLVLIMPHVKRAHIACSLAIGCLIMWFVLTPLSEISRAYDRSTGRSQPYTFLWPRSWGVTLTQAAIYYGMVWGVHAIGSTIVNNRRRRIATLRRKIERIRRRTRRHV